MLISSRNRIAAPRRTGRIEKITQAALLLLYRENDWTLLPSHNVTSDYRE
jgi:hypothetical protein